MKIDVTLTEEDIENIIKEKFTDISDFEILIGTKSVGYGGNSEDVPYLQGIKITIKSEDISIDSFKDCKKD